MKNSNGVNTNNDREFSLEPISQISLTTAVAIVLAVVALGYFLAKTSPQNSQKTAAQSSGGGAAALQNSVASGDPMAGHHGEAAPAANSEQLNSLVGKPLPAIRLTDKDGKIFTANDLKGKNTVLFFNEGLMCYPACWNQMVAFGGDERFNSDQIRAISVVTDPAKDWQTAIDKMPQLAKAETLFDIGAKTSGMLGMLTTASSMHKGSLPGHTYVVLDKEGVVRFVKDDPNMAIANDLLIAQIAEFN
ncbi:MAG: redoxin domain-containing protein [Candidatus Niyogibacteria bacterium]|nr:redoxin domain-containing protein [Candidatus Niyogibacteria bacterium]